MNDGRSLWDFALALYSSPGVEETVLHLQDQANANVNVLLWACWLQKRGIVLTESMLASAKAAIESWDESVVQVLRKLRRQLKSEEGKSAVIAALRGEIKSAELLAERHCLDLLSAIPVDTPGSVEPDNLGFYLQHLAASADVTALQAALLELPNKKAT